MTLSIRRWCYQFGYVSFRESFFYLSTWKQGDKEQTYRVLGRLYVWD
jgi:hypothetical protein